MRIVNKEGYCPNVLHFHGRNLEQLTGTFQTILYNHLVNNKYDKTRLKIISTWTDEENCCLYQQCVNNNIKLVNCVPNDYDKSQPWYMPNKIKFFIDELEKTSEEIVLFLDGYDVLLTHLDDILERFESQPYRILFGPSCNNYPYATIDKIYGRANKGVYCYFNAGCVMGYTQDLLNFYKQAYQYIHVKNPLESEQYILRIAFSKYSSDKNQNFVGVDFDSKIFQSMGRLKTNFDENEVVFSCNIVNKNNLLIIKDYFDENDYFYTIPNTTTNEILETNKLKNTELLEYIIDSKLINVILFEIQDRTDIYELFRNLSEIAQIYEAKCYCVFSKDFDKQKIQIFTQYFQSKYNYFVLNYTLEELYNTFQ